MEEKIDSALALFADHAQTIAIVEFAALVFGLVVSMIGFLLLRRSLQRDRGMAESRHAELLEKMDQMIGAPPDEQRRIVKEVREHIGVKASAGAPTVSVGLADPRKRDEGDQT